MRNLLAFIFIASLLSCNNDTESDKDNSLKSGTGIPAPAIISYRVTAQHPHDTSAYTQGLEIHNGKMIESTGDYENSSLRITDWKTGEVLKKHQLGTSKIFAEGITVFNGKIYQLTWQNNIVYVYDVNNIEKPLKTFQWPYEGWGITHTATDLIVSDGSANLYFVNPEDFRVKNTVRVIDDRGTVDKLNELEYINGFIYANIYTTSDVVKIDPESGHVIGRMTFENLLQRSDVVEDRTDYFNGIAWDSTTSTMIVTGKRWPKLFEVKLD